MKVIRTNARVGVEHNDTLNQNGNPDFLHINETQKALITSNSDFVEDLISHATNILYADLLALIDNDELIPSSSYRITNYTTTTVQDNTNSAGRNFDIIVTALSTNELSENASATYHEGDTYFSSNNAKLETWEIKYCIDNDTSRFAWADTENGKGVIYYMKDEWGNECPYDFKNIRFKRYSIISMSNDSTDLVFDVNNQRMKYAIKDSYNNIYPIGAVIDENNTSYYFTFNAILQGYATSYNIYDASVIQNRIKTDEGGDFVVQDNKINEAHTSSDNPYDYGQVLKLNNIVINNIINSLVYTERDSGCYSNTFGDNCYSNTFGYNCFSNTFGDACNSNTFSSKCISNTFGNNFGNNTFSFSCDNNTFGNSCNSNTFGTIFRSNTVGNDCNSNTFGNNCYSNTFGDNCDSNTFGGSCYNNTFGNNCRSNTFGNTCQSNTFGNSCWSNNFYIGTSGTTKKDYIRYIVLEDGCKNNNFYSSIITDSNNYLQKIRIKGLEHTAPTDIQITLSEENTKYEWVICYTSGNVLRQYCPDDLVV